MEQANVSLTEIAQELKALRQEMLTLREENQKLAGQVTSLSGAPSQTETTSKTSRRRMLAKMAATLAIGATAAGAALVPQPAEAKLIARPIGNGLENRAGAVATHSTGSIIGTYAGSASFGLIGSVGSLNTAQLPTTSEFDTGLFGISTGMGVYGRSTGGVGNNIGVYGDATSTSGTLFGVFGRSGATATDTGNFYGVYGESGNPNVTNGTYFGVFGKALAAAGSAALVSGVYGESDDDGVQGKTTGTTAADVGVRGVGTGTAYGGYFTGKVHVAGALSKSSGTFKIDHPLDPENKYLYHSFVESPDMMNIYNGNVTLDANGVAEITLPEWFEVLNRDFRYQLTALDKAAPGLHVARQMAGRSFVIAGGAAGQQVSWQLTGIRQDPYARKYPVVVEEDKGAERGFYLHPDVYNQPDEKAVSHVEARKVIKQRLAKK